MPVRGGLLGLGSNVGERRANLQAAVEALPPSGVQVVRCSSTYDTDPVGEVPEQGVADAAVMAEERMATRAALQQIARLPRDQAEVVVLRSIAGLDVGHVAAILGKRPGTVRVLAHRGLRRLKEIIERDA